MSTAPRSDLDPRTRSARAAPPGPVTVGLVLIGGFLIGGPFGTVVAVLTLLVWLQYPALLGGLTAGLLAFAALTSVLGNWPNQDSLRQSFADDRALAAAAGLAAGVALLTTVASAARADRSPRRRPAAAAAPTPSTTQLLSRARWWLPFGAVLLVAVALSVFLAPDALTAPQLAATDALRTGQGFVRPTEGRSGYFAPAPLVLASLFATSTAALLTTLTTLTAAAAMTTGFRLGGRRMALIAGLVAAALPSVWGQGLAGALAALAVTTALLLSWPDRITVARAVAAGAALAVACLSRPESLLIVPVVAVWPLLWRSPDVSRPTAFASSAAILMVTLAAVAPWALHVRPATAPLWPVTTSGPSLGVWSLGLAVEAAAYGLALSEAWRRRLTLPQNWHRHLPWVALPALAVATFLFTVGNRDLFFAIAPMAAVGAAAAIGHRFDAVPREDAGPRESVRAR